MKGNSIGHEHKEDPEDETRVRTLIGHTKGIYKDISEIKPLSCKDYRLNNQQMYSIVLYKSMYEVWTMSHIKWLSDNEYCNSLFCVKLLHPVMK